MTPTEFKLWEKIKDFSIADSSSDISFTDRLARENSWTTEYAIRVIYEYKKFIFMMCVSGHPLTPSDQVDQVWHLHLIFTESYWIEFCEKTLGNKIHHRPTKEEASEKNNYIDLYQKTKSLYTHFFNQKPPEDIWPPTSIRFGETNFTRVNLHNNWVIKTPSIFKKWKF